MQEVELRLNDLIFVVVRRWRVLIVVGLVAAFVLGGYKAIPQWKTMNNPDKIAEWQSEYEKACNDYQKDLELYDLKIESLEALTEKAEKDLDSLDQKTEKYQVEIEELNVNVMLYEEQMKAIEDSIRVLEQEKEKQLLQSGTYNSAVCDIVESILASQDSVRQIRAEIWQLTESIEKKKWL